MSGNKEGAAKRQSSKNPHAPQGKHWCSGHPNKDGTVGKYLAKSKFSGNRTKAHGLHNRCNDCQKQYRLDYEAQYGKRNENSKTIRVGVSTHGIIKKLSESSGAAMYEYVRAAVLFYAQHGCQYPGCIQPKSRYGKCREHMLAIAPRQREAS